MIWCEALLQLPFFFYAVDGFMHRRDSIRIPCIIYGAHVATTLVPILAETFDSKEIQNSERNILLSFYTPYLVVPLSLIVYMTAYPLPFSQSMKRI